MIKVLIKTDTRYPVNRKIVRAAVLDTLAKNRMGESDMELSVAFVGQRKMQDLCDTFLGDGEKHEVLSFPFEELTYSLRKGFISPPDGILRLGEIVFCWPQVLLAASRDGVMVDDEVFQLTQHSVLHLLGKHHDQVLNPSSSSKT